MVVDKDEVRKKIKGNRDDDDYDGFLTINDRVQHMSKVRIPERKKVITIEDIHKQNSIMIKMLTKMGYILDEIKNRR